MPEEKAEFLSRHSIKSGDIIISKLGEILPKILGTICLNNLTIRTGLYIY